MMPFYQLGSFDYATAMALATLLGVGFGFALERGGFGRSTILSAQFYGRDNRVLKVMFSAIATAAVGLGLFAAIGVLDLSALAFPETFLGPQIVGGLLLGAGFVIAGYCPGTSVVATASGNLDGLIAFGGIMVGSILFGFTWPVMETFYNSGDLGVRTLPALLGVPWAVVAMGVVVMAIGTFFGAEKLEAFLLERDKQPVPTTDAGSLRKLALGLGTVAVLALFGLAAPAPAEPEPAPVADTRWDLLTLGEHLVAGNDDVWLVDLRPMETCARDRIPGAICRPEGEALGPLVRSLPSTRPLLFYGAGDLEKLPSAASAFKGPIHRLDGGFAAFSALRTEAPALPENPSVAVVQRHERLRALHAFFSGATDVGPPPKIERKVIQRAARKGGGC